MHDKAKHCSWDRVNTLIYHLTHVVINSFLIYTKPSISCSLSKFLYSERAVVTVSYGSWIYNYLCNQCLSPLMLWVRISIRARCTPLCDKVCRWLATGRWFSLAPPVSSTNKTDRQDITEILLKVALNTIKQTTN